MSDATTQKAACPASTPAHKPHKGQRCTALKADGTRCKAWAKRNTVPPRCVMHTVSPVSAPPGAVGSVLQSPPQTAQPPADETPPGAVGSVLQSPPQTAQPPADETPPGQLCFPGMSHEPASETPTTPPPETIEEVIGDLASKQATLSNLIDTCMKGGVHLADLVKLFALHGQNASRLGRLLRDQRALSGDAADGIAGAIAQALDELSNELGTEL